MKTYTSSMKSLQLLTLVAVLFAGVSCGEAPSDIEAKKSELSEYNNELRELKAKITTLEKEIAQMDPEFGKENTNAILVATMPVPTKDFFHMTEVRGWVASHKNVMMSAETMGKVQAIQVTEGQKVSKGQVLLTLDADIIRSNISEVQTSLELAKTLFERQSKLWEQKIGTEVQYLEAKNRKESMEDRLATLNSQLAQSVIRAPFSGRVDEIPATLGSIASPGMPLVRVLSEDDMYIKADISEVFIGKFTAGDPVEVYFPVQDKTVTAKVLSVGQVINSENRTFTVEVSLPKLDFTVRPNQVTVLQLIDYKSSKALVVPTKIILRDDKGTFVYTVTDQDGSLVATKVHIETGLTFKSETEVIKGLQGTEKLIEKGYRDVAEGVSVTLAAASK
jgi:membrane fusion protein, multidrug efflux system